MGNVAVRLLGTAELTADGASLALDTRKAIALVAYLAVEGRASRDTLAALLWPESDAARARATLRRTLSALRSASGDAVIVADRSSVALSAGAESDVAAFATAIAVTGTHGHALRDVCPACLRPLEEAAAAYRGDFLAGFSLRDSGAFDDWARVVAEGFRLDVTRALERLAMGRAAEGDYRGAIDAAARWIELDPLHEPAYRSLMLLAAWAGDRPGAIEAYRRCVSVLAGELGVPPLEETTELYEAILDDDLPPPPGVRRRPEAAAPPVAGALIGRRAELQTLERELMWAATGGRTVVVTGDAWMGKTRLVEDFTAGTAAAGHRVLMARGYRAEALLAYGVIVQLLRAAGDSGYLEGVAVDEWVMSETGRLVPGWGPSPIEGNGEARLFDAVATMLLALSRNRPLVLAVDDGQWIDPGSAALLSYLTHRIGDAGVLLIVAIRSDPTEPDTILESFADRGAVVSLAPLAVGDLAGLVADETAAQAVIEETGGIPLLVSEYLAGADAADLSSGMRRYIDGRLRSLDGLSAQIVAAAAVLDGSCDIPLLRAVSGRTEDEVVDAVDALMRHRIIREVPGTARLGFVLEAMEQVVYAGLTPVRCRLLHRRSAAALAERPGADRDPRSAATVAGHLRSGGEDAEAAEWFALAGQLAAAVYAHSEAEAAYRAALALGPRTPVAIQYALGEVLLLGARYGDALEVYQATAVAAGEELAASAEHRIGEVHRRLGRFDLAEHHFALAEAHHPEPATLYADWALLDHRRGDVEGAAELARRAVRLAEAAGDPRVEGRARDILGIVTEDVAELERALDLAGDDPVLRLAALNSLAYAVAADGGLERALLLVGEAVELAARVGDRHRRAALLNHLADLEHRAGREEESQAAMTAAVRLFADIEPDAWEPEVWLLSRW